MRQFRLDELARSNKVHIHQSPWRISRSPALSYAFPNAHFDSLGLAPLAK
jgi:hypothetical protein